MVADSEITPVLPFWGYFSMDGHSAGTRFFDERLGDYALVELVQNPISRLLHVCSVLNAENETARNRCNIWPLRAYSL